MMGVSHVYHIYIYVNQANIYLVCIVVEDLINVSNWYTLLTSWALYRTLVNMRQWRKMFAGIQLVCEGKLHIVGLG